MCASRRLPLFARDGMHVVERHNFRLGPEHGCRFHQLVRSQRVLWEGLSVERHQLRRGVRPARLEQTVPNGTIVEYFYFPDAILAGVGVLIDSAFPPLLDGVRGG